MITSSICLSHSPLLDRARAERSVESLFNTTISRTATALAAATPDAVIVFYPDHLNGFFDGPIPDFAMCEAAESLGDWGTAPGNIEVPVDLVRSLSTYLTTAGFNVPVFPSTLVDHGAAQPIELLHVQAPIIPFFINCAALPRPSFKAVEDLGRSVGHWAHANGKRIAIVGSGGLSHDPPLPQRTAHSTGLPMAPKILTHKERVARQARVYAAAEAFAAGSTSLSRPLAPDWDVEFMNALAEGRTDIAENWDDSDVSETGGNGAHEVRCWIAAMAAVSAAGPFEIMDRYYAPVPEWLTGMGILSAVPTSFRKQNL